MTITDAPVTHKRCRCGGCNEVFSTLGNFDKHRKGMKCHDPKTVGLEVKTGPNGTWWGQPGNKEVWK